MSPIKVMSSWGFIILLAVELHLLITHVYSLIGHGFIPLEVLSCT